MEKGDFGLSHLFTTVFLYCFANFMVIPAITDVTLAALCPGKEECSLAIYLSGAQQAVIGLGSLVVMPLVGNLSDTYGRKVMLTVPITLTVFPLVILGYSRTRYFFYAYFVLKTLISMASEGSVQFLALAYVADNVPETKRASVFGMMSGIASSSFVFGNFSTRFLSTSATFQVAGAMSVIALVYMRVFLPESNGICKKTTETDPLLGKGPSKKSSLIKTLPSLDDTICLLRTSPTFSKAAVVAFFFNVADVGLYASLMYYLKVQFHFSKDQFADLMIIGGISGSVSHSLCKLPQLLFGGSDGPLVFGRLSADPHALANATHGRREDAFCRPLFRLCAYGTLQHCLGSLGSICSCNDHGRFHFCTAMPKKHSVETNGAKRAGKDSRLHYRHMLLCQHHLPSRFQPFDSIVSIRPCTISLSWIQHHGLGPCCYDSIRTKCHDKTNSISCR